jgi:ferredoxin
MWRAYCEQELMMKEDHAVAEPLQFKRLREGYPLGLREDACLALLSPRYASCRACEEICPARALKVGESALELAETCVNCGRCAAACPMGALGIPGFSVLEIRPAAGKPVAVECWKVPAEISAPDAVRVPCTGGLSAGRIVELAVMAGARPVQILDRGWCAACRAGGGKAHPAAAALERARGLLEKAGMEAGSLPGIVSATLPVDYMPMEIPAPISQQTLSRRAFFGALASKTTAAVDQVRPLAPRAEARRKRGFEREPVPSRERSRQLRGLHHLTQRSGRPMPGSLFHRVEVSDACRNHLLCAKVCPTGALDVYEEETRSGLVFDSYTCIGCGLCAEVCPSDALRLLPNGNNPVPAQPVQLTGFGQKGCPRCGQVYDATAGEEVCPQCAKRNHLASSAFRTLFGGGRE